MKFESWMHEIVHLTRVNEELSSEGNSPIVLWLVNANVIYKLLERFLI